MQAWQVGCGTAGASRIRSLRPHTEERRELGERAAVAWPTGLRPAGRQPQGWYPKPRRPGTGSRPWRNSLMSSCRPEPRPWHRPLVGWEEKSQRRRPRPGTFHLQSVEHGAAVHHVQHCAAAPQAGEDLEDKSRQGMRGCRDGQSPALCAVRRAWAEPALSQQEPLPVSPPPQLSGPLPSPRAWAAPAAQGTLDRLEKEPAALAPGGAPAEPWHLSPPAPSPGL